MTSINSVPKIINHDEIDLLIILRSIWQQKLLIGAIAFGSIILAALYIFNVTPDYEVSTLLRPAAINDLDEINRSKVYALPPNEALKRVGAALDSYDTRLGYFRSNPQLQAAFSTDGRTQEQAFEEFNFKALKLIQPDPSKSNALKPYIGLEMRYPKGLDGKTALNGLVQYAIESERQKVSQDLKVIVSNRIREVDANLDSARVDYFANKDSRIAELAEEDNLKIAQLKDELRALRLQLKLRRENRISQLNEAIMIARSLGLKKPSTPSSMGQSDVETTGNVFRTEVINQQMPLYFMGTDALEAEKSALRKRVSDDFADPRIAAIRKELLLLEKNRNIEMLRSRDNEDLFLKGIEPLRAERARLNSISTDLSNVQLVSIDRYAVEPHSPVWPNKKLIFVIALILGIVVGIFVAFLRCMISFSQHGNHISQIQGVPVIENKG